MHKRLMQLRDLRHTRAHLGWAYYLSGKIAKLPGPQAFLIKRIQEHLEQYTDGKKALFDLENRTETCSRCFVPVRQEAQDSGERWGYSAICADFLREMLNAIPVPLDRYGFVDVGSGKGAAVMHARSFPFRRFYGVELSPDLAETALRNCRAYSQSIGQVCHDTCTLNENRTDRPCCISWICCDFFQWRIPQEPLLFFLNNPFPPALNIPAIEHIQSSAAPTLLVFRKPNEETARYLDQSKHWRALRRAPYWRVYATGQQ